jgi:hypothetical protein
MVVLSLVGGDREVGITHIVILLKPGEQRSEGLIIPGASLLVEAA